MEIVDNKKLLIRTRNPNKYNIIPQSRVLNEVDGICQIEINWGLDEVRVLKTLGVRNVPSPIMRDYNWPGIYTPFKHQKETSEFFTLNRRAFCFSEPGTGKTLSALWAADYLMSRGEVHRVLVLCPLSIMYSAWIKDLSHSIIHRSAIVCHASAEKRVKIIEREYEFVITNYDSLPIIHDAIQKDGRFNLVIVDEANAFKNVSTTRWKLLNKLIKPNVSIWMMTGTPAAQSPLDAFGLARIVNPSAVPPFMSAWRDRVMFKAGMFKWIPKKHSENTVHEALQPAIRYTKAECLDLPPVVTQTREVPLTSQQNKYYKLIKEKSIAEAAGEIITAVNAAATVNKLLQISAGASYTDGGEVVVFDCSPRLAVLKEVIEETPRKILVFATYRHSIETIRQFLEKEGVSCRVIQGDVKVSERTEIFKEFQTKEEPKVLIIQPQSASHGVTLTAADTVVYWSPVSSIEIYLQGVSRADRMGQNAEKVTVIHLSGSPIEKRLYEVLEQRIEKHNLLADLYEQEIKE